MAYIDKYGAEFNDDKKELIKVPTNYCGVYEIPQGTECVHWGAFKGCSKITVIVLPDTVSSFYEEDAGYGWEDFNLLATCKKLSYFVVDSQNKDYYSIEGVLCRKSDNMLVAYPIAKQDEFVLPDNILLSWSAEHYCEDALFISSYLLSRIQIPDTNPNYTLIDNALYNKNIEELIKVKPDAKSYTMPNSVKVITDGAFVGCTKLTKIFFGSSLTYVSEWVETTLQDQLRYCKAVKELTVHPNNEYFRNTENGFVYWYDEYSYDPYHLIYFPPAKKTKRIMLPDYSIDSRAFANCINIQRFELGKDSFIPKIGKDVFNDTAFFLNSDNWKDDILYINNTLIKVSDNYVEKQLVIPAGTKIITEDSVSSPNITSIIIEDGVRYFDSSAITCPNLKEIKFPKTLSVWYREQYAFAISLSQSKQLEKILIPKGMRSFFLMYCSVDLHHLLVEYDENNQEKPIYPLSEGEKEYYKKIHSYGFPDFLQYTLVKIELMKGIALSQVQIYSYLEKNVNYTRIFNTAHIDIVYRLKECFRRDGLSLKSIKSKDVNGKEVELYYLESPKNNE